MRSLLISLLLLISALGSAQVTISGKITYAPGENIKVLSNSDHISGKKQVLSTVRSDSAGSFLLQFEQNKSGYIEIVTDHYRSVLHVLPGGTYKVQFNEPDSGEVETLGREIPVGLEILSSTDSINSGIEEVNTVIDSFFNVNYKLFALKAAKPVVDKFKPSVARRFSNAHPVVRIYLKYSFAPIDEAVFRERSSLYNEYFSGPVLLENRDYMNYFDQHFIRFLQVMMMGKCEGRFDRSLNVTRSFDEMVSVLRECDTIIKNDTLASLIVLKGLQELYSLPKQNKQNILMVLDKKAQTDKGILGSVAKNISEELTYLKEGTASPVSRFVDLDGKELELSALKGKYVYLFFWASWCDPCLQELKVLSSLHERYKRKVVFAGVSIDKDRMSAVRSAKRNKMTWFTMHDSTGSLKHAFRVRSVPQYFLIDPEGDMMPAPPSPGENLRGFLEELSRKK